MRFRELCSKIAKAEGKKHEALICDVREILALLVHEIVADPKAQACFLDQIRRVGEAKAKKSPKAKPKGQAKK